MLAISFEGGPTGGGRFIELCLKRPISYSVESPLGSLLRLRRDLRNNLCSALVNGFDPMATTLSLKHPWQGLLTTNNPQLSVIVIFHSVSWNALASQTQVSIEWQQSIETPHLG
jgi:hypothetical protein